MTDLVGTIVLIPLLAVLAPLAARAIRPWLPVPVVVLMRDADPLDHEAVESKIEGLAFGFLVPLFFIYTGVTFDLGALLADPRLLALVPVALVVMLFVRGLPSTLAAPAGSDGRTKTALMLLGATGLPIIVAVTGIGVKQQLISSGLASVLVGAGMLSVLLFPLIAMSLRGSAPADELPAGEGDAGNTHDVIPDEA